MYAYDNNPLAEQEINLPEDNISNSNQNNFKYNFSYDNNILKTKLQTYLNNNNSLNYKCPQKINNTFNVNRQSDNITPHKHHHHLIHLHHHCNSPHSHSHSASRSCSCSCSPSPIKNVSQPLINSNNQILFNSSSEVQNKKKLIYINEKSNDLNSCHTNDYINNIYTKKIREHEIDKSNSFFNSNSMNDNELNYLNALDFDEYMSKVALNKYNKLKQFNESYYIKKQNGEEEINNNNISNLDDLNLMKKHLDQKYQLYNLISKYDQINYKKKEKNEREEREKIEEKGDNNFNRNERNKNINNENANDISNENIRNIDIDKFNENINNYNQKRKTQIDLEKNISNKTHHHKNKYAQKNNENNISKSSKSYDCHSFADKNKNNFVKESNNNKIMIQKAFNESIGPDNNNNFIFSSQYNIEKKNQENNNNKENENLYNNPDNLNKQSLLDYLKKENEDLKKLNNSYKHILDTLFYFLNNISHKYHKEEGEQKQLFDLSKDLNDTENFSKKLISLEYLVNEAQDKILDKKNDNNNKGISNDENSNTHDKRRKLLLSITKENSIQFPELTKLDQFNDLVKGMGEKCFTFKNEDFIGNNNNTNSNRYYKNDSYIKNLINTENNKRDIDKELIERMNNENDRCVACLLGCNVTRRGYSPMKYNPNNKKELRIEDSSDLLERYNDLKVKIEKENLEKIDEEGYNNKKISKSNNNSKSNLLNDNRNKSKSAKNKKKV